MPQVSLPPENLIYRVTGTTDANWFVTSGRQSVQDIQSALLSVGRTLAGNERILDFGCGCGRILLHLSEVVPPASITGVDIDSEATEWLRPKVDATIVTIPELPPMPFNDGSFDLVYCHSVFTHLDENYQDRWLAELRRVVRPGATLVVSFSGAKAVEHLRELWTSAGADAGPMLAQLEAAGLLYIEDDEWINGPFPPFYHSTFHTLDYVREHWGAFFRILNHIPGGSLDYQDFIVMERTDSQEPVTVKKRTVSVPAPARSLPLPPLEMRRLVGATDEIFYDNPSGDYVFPEVPPQLYAAVFDFASGCGRQARQLMLQKTPPSRYLGIDIHREMVEWCRSHLTAANPAFQFQHHDVYNPGLAPGNSRRLTAPFPAGDGEFTLVNAHSVFTHIYQHQTEFYLSEIARILAPSGIARTTWFFFSRRAFPWLETWQNSIFVNADDPTNAVIYDVEWFLVAVRSAGLAVRQTVFPGVPGHQWQIFLERRTEASADHFPTAEEAAGWLCGAVTASDQAPPDLTGQAPLHPAIQDAEVQHLRNRMQAAEEEVRALRNSWSWKLTSPLRRIAGLF
ncbi:MAG: class I SAM-dependent methyltransferase [Bryobacteraceae bacterium]|nr:class I SAM-dependent methyltransferase [Bryobacteraceae bacterium]